MSIFDFLMKRKPEEVVIAANNIQVNVSNEKQFKRNVARLENLFLAVSQGDVRKEVKDEIEKRKEVCTQFGHSAPNTLKEAQQLREKVK